MIWYARIIIPPGLLRLKRSMAGNMTFKNIFFISRTLEHFRHWIPVTILWLNQCGLHMVQWWREIYIMNLYFNTLRLTTIKTWQVSKRELHSYFSSVKNPYNPTKFYGLVDFIVSPEVILLLISMDMCFVRKFQGACFVWSDWIDVPVINQPSICRHSCARQPLTVKHWVLVYYHPIDSPTKLLFQQHGVPTDIWLHRVSSCWWRYCG